MTFDGVVCALNQVDVLGFVGECLAFKDELSPESLELGEGHDAIDAVGEDVNRAIHDFAAVLDSVDDCREFCCVVGFLARDTTAKSCLAAGVVVELEAPACATVLKRAIGE